MDLSKADALAITCVSLANSSVLFAPEHLVLSVRQLACMVLAIENRRSKGAHCILTGEPACIAVDFAADRKSVV